MIKTNKRNLYVQNIHNANALINNGYKKGTMYNRIYEISLHQGETWQSELCMTYNNVDQWSVKIVSQLDCIFKMWNRAGFIFCENIFKGKYAA